MTQALNLELYKLQYLTPSKAKTINRCSVNILVLIITSQGLFYTSRILVSGYKKGGITVRKRNVNKMLSNPPSTVSYLFHSLLGKQETWNLQLGSTTFTRMNSMLSHLNIKPHRKYSLYSRITYRN